MSAAAYVGRSRSGACASAAPSPATSPRRARSVALVTPRAPVPHQATSCGAGLVDQGHGERADLPEIARRSPSAATVAVSARLKCPSHRPASPREIGLPSWLCFRLVQADSLYRRGPAQPLGEEQLLPRLSGGCVPPEQRAQQSSPSIPSYRRSTSRSTVGWPPIRSNSPVSRKGRRPGALFRKPRCARPGGWARCLLSAEGGGVLSPPRARRRVPFSRGALLLRHGCVHLRRDPARSPTKGHAYRTAR